MKLYNKTKPKLLKDDNLIAVSVARQCFITSYASKEGNVHNNDDSIDALNLDTCLLHDYVYELHQVVLELSARVKELENKK